MADCPFGPNAHVKRKIEPAQGVTLWFGDVPEGGVTEDTYLFAGASEKGSRFNVEPHFHPNSAEHFVITKGQAHFTLDGKPYTVEEGGHFVIPRGVVHTVSSPENEVMEFKARGDLDLVAERDYLMQMFALIETNQFGLLKKYTCWYQSGNFVPKVWPFPKIVGRILVWFIGGVLGTLLGLGKADLKKD